MQSEPDRHRWYMDEPANEGKINADIIINDDTRTGNTLCVDILGQCSP